MQLSAKWITLFLLVWTIGAYLGSTYNGYTTETHWAGTGDGGYSQNVREIKGAIMGGYEANQRNSLVGNIPFVGPAWGWLMAIWQIITWQFPFLDPYPMIQEIFTFFGAMAVLSLIILLYGAVRGNLTWGIALFVVFPTNCDLPQFNKKTNEWTWEKSRWQRFIDTIGIIRIN